MLITAAYAQTTGAGPFGGASDTLVQLVPIVAMIAIVYFVLWRPQQRRAKEQREMVTLELIGPVAANLPVGVDFIARPFNEAMLFRIASAFEAATRHRKPPPEFGPLPDEP